MTELEKTGLARGLTITGDADCALDLRRSSRARWATARRCWALGSRISPKKVASSKKSLVAEQRPWIAPACLASTLWMPLIQPAFSGSFGRSAASARNSSSVADQPGAERGLALVTPTALAEMALEHGRLDPVGAPRAPGGRGDPQRELGLERALRRQPGPQRAGEGGELRGALATQRHAVRAQAVPGRVARALPAAPTGPRERAPLRRAAAARAVELVIAGLFRLVDLRAHCSES